MDFEDAGRIMEEQEIVRGSFIEVDISGTVVTLAKKGGMRLSDGTDESTVSGMHVMESSLGLQAGPMEVTATLRGYFEGWASGRRAYLRLLGNGATSRIVLRHIVTYRAVSRPTLEE